MSQKTNLNAPHIAAQVTASWSAFDRTVRTDQLQHSLDNLNDAFTSAMGEMQRIRDFVGSPESILGNSATKHGEIAEHVHVGVTRAFDVLHGRAPSATFEGIGRTSPIDYQVNGVDVQSKYLNGLKRTLDGVLEHARKYPDFAKGNSEYHIPKDLYEQLQELQATGRIEGLSDQSASTISKKLENLQRLTGRDSTDLLKPGEASYQEVQKGNIHNTIDSRAQRLTADKNNLQDAERIKYGPSIQGLGQAAVLGAVAGGGVRVAQAFWKKWQGEGKNPFQGDFTVSDWQEIGIDTVKGASGGAIAGGTLYWLTNATDLAAPVAGSVVSGLMGIGHLLHQYHAGKISSEQFLDLSLIVASEAAIVGIATATGQSLIPIPILGALIGSMAGKLVASALKDTLGNSEQALITQLQQYQTLMLEKLDYQYRSIVTKIDQYFDNLDRFLALAFNEEVNLFLRLEASVQLAENCGVPNHLILRSSDDLDRFMME
jgi:hypothetical protein